MFPKQFFLIKRPGVKVAGTGYVLAIEDSEIKHGDVVCEYRIVGDPFEATYKIERRIVQNKIKLPLPFDDEDVPFDGEENETEA